MRVLIGIELSERTRRVMVRRDVRASIANTPQEVEEGLLEVPAEEAVDERVDDAGQVLEEGGQQTGVAGQPAGVGHDDLVELGDAEGREADEVGQHDDQQAAHSLGTLAVLGSTLRPPRQLRGAM